jgi:hypothetical protein
VSTAFLRQEAAEGRLQPNDLVWREGMPQWIVASAAREVFPAQTSDFDVPLEEPSRHAPEPDLEDTPARRRPRPRERRAPGLSTGAIVAIILSISAVVILVLVGVVIFLINRDTFTTRSGSYTVFLFPGGRDSKPLFFSSGRRVHLHLNTDRHVNLTINVYDARGMLIHSHMRQGIDHHVDFFPPRSETYRIEIIHNGVFGPNGGQARCHVNYRQS